MMRLILPDAWYEALRCVQSVHPEAVLAGGALRDTFLGGEVKDLDIFVENYESNLTEVLELRHGWRRLAQINAEYVSSMRDEVRSVVSYRVPNLDKEVQVIFLKSLKSPYEALERMDFYACQIGAVGPSHFFYTPAAWVDLISREITMVEPENHIQERRSLVRADRFAEKYAGTDVRVVRKGPTTRLSAAFVEAFVSP